jgi:hypothetical protein
VTEHPLLGDKRFGAFDVAQQIPFSRASMGASRLVGQLDAPSLGFGVSHGFNLLGVANQVADQAKQGARFAAGLDDGL